MQRLLVVMARWPAPGRCKRRLAGSCGSAVLAARIQERLNAHSIAVAAEAAERCDAQLQLAVDGLGPRALQRWGQALRQSTTPGRCCPRVAAQGQGTLGCRMDRQWRRGFRRGAEAVVLIGTDLPTLECLDLETAFAQLQTHPLVLGPASDGGYWLIGLDRRGFARAGHHLMAGIPWGSAAVLAETLQRAEELQLPAALLRQQRDLDRRSDLAAWRDLPQRSGVGGWG